MLIGRSKPINENPENLNILIGNGPFKCVLTVILQVKVHGDESRTSILQVKVPRDCTLLPRDCTVLPGMAEDDIPLPDLLSDQEDEEGGSSDDDAGQPEAKKRKFPPIPVVGRFNDHLLGTHTHTHTHAHTHTHTHTHEIGRAHV